MALIIAQTGMVLMLAVWLSVAVYDNIRTPAVNGTLVSEVLTMQRLQDEYPDLYALHQGRVVTDERVHRFMFRLIVTAEVLTAIALWAGAVTMALAFWGAVQIETARGIAMLGALAFSGVWSGFLIFGNYWCYWMCHDGAQSTHFKLVLWGLGVLLLLAA